LPRFAEIDDPACGEKLRDDDRHAQRQRVGPDQAAVALRPPTTQAAHQAKPAQQSNRAIGKANDETGKDDDVGA
jgi:hypothetical protein